MSLRNGYRAFALVMLALGVAPAIGQTPLGTAFTYQGNVRLAGEPLNASADFQFTLWDAATLGNQIGAMAAVSNVVVEEGLFTASIDFGAAAFGGQARWIEIAVRSPAGSGPFTTLSPRQALTAAPYALHALNNWSRTGNPGTNPATQFLGTTDNQPLVLKVNNRRAMQYQYVTGGFYQSINTLGGADNNVIGAGVVGATIAGGGGTVGDLGAPVSNEVLWDFGTVGGGLENTSGDFATTVAGGHRNTASDRAATVAGGEENDASGLSSTVAGGYNNTASGGRSTVAGGYNNTASGTYSTVAGGVDNAASGDNSFAAGTQAKATHVGTFVWADDSTSSDFASTGTNQFLIRALGGVGIGTNAPTNRLSVAGNADFSGNVGVGTNAPTNRLSVAGTADFSGNLGVGTNTPTNRLSVAGNADFGGNVGVGTSAPTVRLHIRSEGPVLNVEGASHAYVQYFPYGAVSGRKAFMGFPGAGGTEFTISNEIAGGFLNLSATNVRVVGNFINNSDARDKRDVRGIDDALTIVEQLRGVRYRWNECSIGGEALPTGEQLGFLAQDVEHVLPEAVATSDDGRKGVSYVSLVPVLVEAIKQQQARFDAALAERDAELAALRAEKDAQIAERRAENAELNVRLERLEKALEALTDGK